MIMAMLSVKPFTRSLFSKKEGTQSSFGEMFHLNINSTMGSCVLLSSTLACIGNLIRESILALQTSSS